MSAFYRSSWTYFSFFFLTKGERERKIRTITIHHVMIVNRYHWYFIRMTTKHTKNIMMKSHTFTSIHHTFFVVTYWSLNWKRKWNALIFFPIFLFYYGFCPYFRYNHLNHFYSEFQSVVIRYSEMLRCGAGSWRV